MTPRRLWSIWCERRVPVAHPRPEDEPAWLDDGDAWPTREAAEENAAYCRRACPDWRYEVREVTPPKPRPRKPRRALPRMGVRCDPPEFVPTEEGRTYAMARTRCRLATRAGHPLPDARRCGT